VVETVLALIESCNRHGVAPGIQCRAAALSKKWIERGMRFVGTGSEHGFLLQKVNETMAELSAARAATAAAKA
jgi:2-keto-3-deoxy-L-rhamnonate aldolase RhmA